MTRQQLGNNRAVSADSGLSKTRKKVNKGKTQPLRNFGSEQLPKHRSSAELRNISANSKIPRRLAPLEHIKILYKGAAKKQDAKATIHEKKDLMRLVREIHNKRNKPQRKLMLSELAKTSDMNASRLSVKLNTAKQEKRTLEANVNNKARQYNTLKDSVARDKSLIQTMLDDLALIERDVKALRAAEQASTTETLRIEELRMLVADTDKKINVELFNKAQLTHMARRLRHNLVAYESHINDLNLAIEASSREIVEVEVLLKQLENKKIQSDDKMEATKNEITEETRVREEELSALQEEVRRAERMVEWRQERQRQRMLDQAEAGGDLDEKGEKALISQSKQLEQRDSALQAASKSTLDKELTMEEAFMQIRRATGINTLEEMVEKFMGQMANKAALEQEKKEAEDHLQLVRTKLKEAETRFSDLRASGIGGMEFSREAYDQLENEISKLQSNLKYNTLACKRLENVQVSCRLGALGLAQRLAPLTNLLDASDETTLVRTGIESLDALIRCQKKVAKMIDIIHIKKQDGASGENDNTIADESADAAEDNKGETEEDAVLNGTRPHINNIRVDTIEQMRKRELEEPVAKPDLISAVVGQDDGGVGDDDNGDSDEEVLDVAELRAKMKAEAALIASGKKAVIGRRSHDAGGGSQPEMV